MEGRRMYGTIQQLWCPAEPLLPPDMKQLNQINGKGAEKNLYGRIKCAVKES
jgi:hypothetical protein